MSRSKEKMIVCTLEIGGHQVGYHVNSVQMKMYDSIQNCVYILLLGVSSAFLCLFIVAYRPL